jgi:predicted phosphodiesterase
MKYIVDIPDNIVDAFRNNTKKQFGRIVMENQYGIPMNKARLYAAVLRDGDMLHTDQVQLVTESGETRKALILPDMHIPYHDEMAIGIAINEGHRQGIDTVVILGDGVDCYDVSYWKKDPMRPRFPKEREIAKSFIQKFDKAFPSYIEKIWIEGNHEQRVRWLIWQQAKQFADIEELSIPSLYGFRDLGWKYISNTELKRAGAEPFKLGKCYMFHGHEIGMSGGAVNFAKLHYDKDPICQCNAHHHQEQHYTIRKSSGEVDGSWILGCLCDLNPEYAPFNRWNHGFGIIEWNDETFRVTPYKIIDGKLI